jgi:putative transposase
MDITLTAKIKISPTIEQAELLQQTLSAYRSACNYVSALIHEIKMVLCQENGHIKQREIAELRQLLFSD